MRHDRRERISWIALFEAVLLSALLAVGMGTVHFVVHLIQDHGIQDHGTANTPHNGCCSHSDSEEHEKEPLPDSTRDCPQCQALLTLQTVDAAPYNGGHIYLYDGFETLPIYETIVSAPPLTFLPAIRAPPAGNIPSC